MRYPHSSLPHLNQDAESNKRANFISQFTGSVIQDDWTFLLASCTPELVSEHEISLCLCPVHFLRLAVSI